MTVGPLCRSPPTNYQSIDQYETERTIHSWDNFLKRASLTRNSESRSNYILFLSFQQPLSIWQWMAIVLLAKWFDFISSIRATSLGKWRVSASWMLIVLEDCAHRIYYYLEHYACRPPRFGYISYYRGGWKKASTLHFSLLCALRCTADIIIYISSDWRIVRAGAAFMPDMTHEKRQPQVHVHRHSITWPWRMS